MKIQQILLLCGVIISSVTTSFYLVKMFSLLWKYRDKQSISDKELDNNLKYMVISIVLLTICSLVYCVISIVGQSGFMSITKKIEYQSVVRDILDNEEFKKLYLEPHHGISRYLHVLRVSKIAFGFCKDLEGYDAYERLSIHPYKALDNSLKYYNLSDLERDIIVKHMYPHTKERPKYFGTYLVSICDKVAAIYEMSRFKLALKFSIYLLFIYNIISIKIEH